MRICRDYFGCCRCPAVPCFADPDATGGNLRTLRGIVCNDPTMTAGRVLRVRAVAGGLLLAGGLALALGFVYFSTLATPSTVWTDRLFVRTWVSGAAALVVVLVGLGLIVRERRRFTATALATVVIALGLAVGVFFAGNWNHHASPDWSGKTSDGGLLRTNVLVSGSAAPRWVIRVEETGHGPFGRLETVGCTGWGVRLTGLDWHDDVLTIQVDGGRVDVTFGDHATETAIVEHPDGAVSPNVLVDC